MRPLAAMTRPMKKMFLVFKEFIVAAAMPACPIVPGLRGEIGDRRDVCLLLSLKETCRLVPICLHLSPCGISLPALLPCFHAGHRRNPRPVRRAYRAGRTRCGSLSTGRVGGRSVPGWPADDGTSSPTAQFRNAHAGGCLLAAASSLRLHRRGSR